MRHREHFVPMGFETCTTAPCSPRRAAGELWGTAVTPPAAQQPFLPPSQLFTAAKLRSAPLSVRPRTQGLCTSRGRAWLSGATWPGLVEAPRALGYRPAQAAPSGALSFSVSLKRVLQRVITTKPVSVGSIKPSEKENMLETGAPCPGDCVRPSRHGTPGFGAQ